MIRLIGFLLMAVLIIFGLSFAVLNAEPVTLNYYLGVREVPLSMVAVLSLITGTAIGLLFSLGTILRLKRQTVSLRKQLHAAEQDADRILVLPAKE